MGADMKQGGDPARLKEAVAVGDEWTVTIQSDGSYLYQKVEKDAKEKPVLPKSN